MRAYEPSTLLLALVVWASACSAAEPGGLALCSEFTEAVSARRESTVTRLTTLAEPYGVGYAWNSYDTGCESFDAPATATFGHAMGGAIWAWAAWSLDGIPASAEVLLVEVEHYLWPDGTNDPDLETRYAQLDSVPCPPPDDCMELWGDLQSGSVYSQVLMGQSPGLRREVLGGSAVGDVQQRLSDRGLFAVTIQTDCFEDPTGSADLPGWSAGGIDLIVTWRDPSTVEPASWSRVKSEFRDR